MWQKRTNTWTIDDADVAEISDGEDYLSVVLQEHAGVISVGAIRRTLRNPSFPTVVMLPDEARQFANKILEFCDQIEGKEAK
jgi:hypothetical protein